MKLTLDQDDVFEILAKKFNVKFEDIEFITDSKGFDVYVKITETFDKKEI